MAEEKTFLTGEIGGEFNGICSSWNETRGEDLKTPEINLVCNNNM